MKPITIQQAIDAYLARNKIDAHELAERAAIDPGNLSRIRSGKREPTDALVEFLGLEWKLIKKTKGKN